MRTTALAAAVAISLAGARVVHQYARHDLSRTTIGFDYGHNLLRSLPARAQLVTQRDNEAFILAYLCLLERARPDVVLYNEAGVIFSNSVSYRELGGVGPGWRRLQAEVVGRAPDRTFFCEGWEAGTIPESVLLPWAFVYRAVPPAAELDLFQGWERFTYRWIYRASWLEDYMVEMITDIYRRAALDHRALELSIAESRRLESLLAAGRAGAAEDSGRAGAAEDSGRAGAAEDSGRAGATEDSGRAGAAEDSGRAGEMVILRLAEIYREAGLLERAIDVLERGRAALPESGAIERALAESRQRSGSAPLARTRS